MVRSWKSALTVGGLPGVAGLIGLGLLAVQLIATAPDGPAPCPVQYVKICSLYGSGYFYIPGTDNCVNANQINATQQALSSFTSTAYTGIAISTAMVAPYVPPNANYAVSVHWGGFQGANAVGVGGLARLGNSNLFVSGGYGTGFSNGANAGRAGFMFAW